jgi:hypothetical protein
MLVPGFEVLADAFLDEEFEANPVAASSLGLTAYDERLDDLSALAFEARDASAVGWLAPLEALDPVVLTEAQTNYPNLLRTL